MKRILTILGVTAALATLGVSTASAKPHKPKPVPAPYFTNGGPWQAPGTYAKPGKHKPGKGFIAIEFGNKNKPVFKKSFRKSVRKLQLKVATLQRKVFRAQAKIAFLQSHNARPYRIRAEMRKLRQLQRQLAQNVRKLNRKLAKAYGYATPGFDVAGFGWPMFF